MLDTIKDHISYDPDTGVFTWTRPRTNRVKPGDKAGCLNVNGYVYIHFGRHNIRAHRLAWFLTYGEWPAELVDHINRVKDDNRLCNLRLANINQNNWNHAGWRDGLKGVSRERNRFVAVIRVNGKRKRLGRFGSEAEAHAAYCAAAAELHGEFARFE